MGFRSVATVALVLAGFAAAARAETLRVPSEAYPTIQSAVDAAEPGDVVLVGPGDYSESVVVTGKTDLQIRGRGSRLLPGAAPGFDVQGPVDGLLLQGFQVEGAFNGVSLAGCANVRLVRLRIVDGTGNGILVSDGAGIVISKCEIAGSEIHGIEDSSSAGLVIEKCAILDCGGDSIRCSPAVGENGGSNNATVAKNRISGGDVAIRFAGTNAVISKNRIEAFGEYAVEVASATNSDGLLIEKNRVAPGGGAVGIKIEAFQVTVSKNVLDASAIFVSGPNKVVDGNRVANALWCVYSDGTDCTISRNKGRDLQSFGIRSNGANCLLDGNSIAGVNGHGIELGGNGQTVTGNRVSGATDNGFDVSTTGNTLTGNRAFGSGGADLRDHNVEGLNTYEGNRFGTVEFEPSPE